MKHFTILEVNDTHEIMMVGTIQNITETNTKQCFWEELQELLESHFDADIKIKDKSIDLFDGGSEYVIDVNVYDNDIKFSSKYKITIMETWFSKNF